MLLADRRYAVLQVNFRGSTALRNEVPQRLEEQLGLNMQDDSSTA